MRSHSEREVEESDWVVAEIPRAQIGGVVGIHCSVFAK